MPTRFVGLFAFIFSGLTATLAVCHLTAQTEDSWPPVPRRLPPAGIEISAEEIDALKTQLQDVEQALSTVANKPASEDIAVLLKAVRFALRFNEFYDAKDIPKAKSLLQLASDRIEQLKRNQASWSTDPGLTVRGYRSRVDGSLQAYGLELPEGIDDGTQRPLYVWLHGRGDKTTDLHFIHQRLNRPGTIKVPNAIIAHPFGRHCVGFKSAGEIDVLEVIEQVKSHYAVDENRIVLAGFSMGGAGAWHIGAHYVDRFVAIAPGAGFAETAEYNRLKPEDFPSSFEQQLWGCYDVPDYVGNLFNVPVIAYSGENDRQIQAARVMERAYEEQGRRLNHVIGPGMGHRYHPDSLKSILSQLAERVEAGRNPRPASVTIQTKTLRYPKVHWLELTALDEHWQTASASGEVAEEHLTLTTTCVRGVKLYDPPPFVQLTIDQQSVNLEAGTKDVHLIRDKDGNWKIAPTEPSVTLRKRHGLSGPIDDVWLEPFLFVVGSKACQSSAVNRWVDFESEHQLERWRALFRGEPRIKFDHEVTPEDLNKYNLVLWGDPASNEVINRVIDDLPIKWTRDQLGIGSQQFDSTKHIPALIYPNPLNPNKYVVLNSGPTFREADDRTNSLQNPKLPDWAIIKVTEAPNANSAGEVVAQDFFDESWQVKPVKPKDK